jgi:hypothetical protein
MTSTEFLAYERAAHRRLAGVPPRRPEESLPTAIRRRPRTADEIYAGFRLAFPKALKPSAN